MKYRSTPRSRIARKQFAEIWRIFSILFGLIVIAGVSYAALIYWITSKPPQSVYFNIVEAWSV
jgi:glucan phosphoethanolaminetransferase (alkaline phosphatase superfamily)